MSTESAKVCTHPHLIYPNETKPPRCLFSYNSLFLHQFKMDLNEYSRISSANRQTNGEFSSKARMSILGLRVAGIRKVDIAKAIEAKSVNTFQKRPPRKL
ncbi:hypothetical protein BKA67DRAFT_588993, partial [Truncatella angustata]